MILTRDPSRYITATVRLSVLEIWANAHETRESLQHFLFANCQSISSHFVAVHSCSVRCSRRSQKAI